MNSSKLLKRLALVFIFALLLTAAVPAVGQQGNTRVWVEFAPGAKGQVQGALQGAGAQFHYTFDRYNYFVVTLPQAAVDGLAGNPNVLSIVEDVPRYPIASSLNSSLLAPIADTIDANGQTVPWGIDAVQARDVWDVDRDGAFDPGAPTGSGVTVCVIDTGYYKDHEDLPNAIGGTSQVDDNWARDGYGHGTHVGGTIAATNNTVGVVGVSPEITFYIIKIFNDAGDWTLSSDLTDAILTCAENGADIISMSLGGGGSVPEMRAFDDLYSQGILHVAAAGNDGTTDYSYPASYDSVISVAAIDESLTVADFSQQNDQVELAAPGVAVLSTLPYIDDNTLVVDGVTYDANHIEYAARGTASGGLADGGLCDSTGAWSGMVVLCERGAISFYDKVINVENSGGAAAVIYNNEPGNFFGTLGDGNSSNIIALSLSQEDGQFLVANKLGFVGDIASSFTWPTSGYESWNGTSMATPHVSAVAALLWAANPTATNVELRDALDQTALDLGPAGRDNAYGYGLVQAADALAFMGGTANNPPVVSITSPADGATFASGELISFSGTASDTEDGDLTASLTWTSSIDGLIGTGGSFSATLSDGTHTITAEVTDSGGKSGSDAISITVGGGGGTQLYVTVTTDKTTYINKETAYITVDVTDGANPIDAAVEVRITTPKGTVYVGNSTTGSDGTVTFSFKTNANKDGFGTYTVDATASKSGYTSGSDSTTFTVQ